MFCTDIIVRCFCVELVSIVLLLQQLSLTVQRRCARSLVDKFQEMKARAFGLHDEMKALQDAINQKKKNCNIQNSVNGTVEEKWR